MKTLIKNAHIVNEGKIFKSDLLIENQIIKKIANSIDEKVDKSIDASYVPSYGNLRISNT